MQGAANSNTTPQTITDSTSSAFAVGRQGATNPVIAIDASTSNVVTGIKITGAATGTAVALVATGSATDEHLTINAKAAGTIKIGNISTGLITLGAMVSSKIQVLASSGNTTMTSAMSGSVMLIDGAGTDFTLPAIGAGDIGMHFRFVSTAVSTSQSITAGSGDLLVGGMVMVDEATPLVDAFHPDVSDDLILATNGTTTGGLIGSTYHFVAISATRWWVEGVNYGSGTLATPFA